MFALIEVQSKKKVNLKIDAEITMKVQSLYHQDITSA